MGERLEERIERRVVETHRETVAETCAAGRAVAASWSGERVTDPEKVTGPLARRLDEAGVPGRLVSALSAAVDAAGGRMAGSPVPAPPYVVVTSRGPTCRATLEDGRRLVLLFDLFEVERRPRAYRFRDPSPDRCPRARLRNDPGETEP